MNNTFGQMLCDSGCITAQQLEQAISAQRGDEHISDALVRLGFASERDIIASIGGRSGIEILPAHLLKADKDIVKLVPRKVLERYRMLPLSEAGGKVYLAVSDPLDFYAIEDIKQILGMTPELYLCESSIILQGISYYYSAIDAENMAQNGMVTVDEESSPAVTTVDALIERGCSIGASDIHIEPFEDDTSVRMRADGMMVELTPLKKEMHQAIIARIKILADLDIAEHRLPQDGNIHTVFKGRPLNMRVSVMPTVYGEKAVLRFLNSDIGIDNSEQFGMDEYSYGKMLDILKVPSGIIYFTGPTGSGKTTTLYMILEELAKRPVNICTIEDPVERRLKKVNQTAVNTNAGVDFGTGLRAILRQDPDIIMLGETRDIETAEISVRAAITGHLVLSTLHTNDAVSAVIRLKDMGIAPYLTANALVGVVAQRLVRKNCPNCAVEVNPTAEERDLIGHDVRYIRRGNGCHLCNFTGYKGRTAIFEILKVDKTIKRMITSNEATEEIYSYACREQGMKTLKRSAAELVAKGITTPEEVLRAAYFAD